MGRKPPRFPTEKTRRPTREELHVWDEVTKEDDRLDHAVIDWDAVSDAVESYEETFLQQESDHHRPAPEQLAKLLSHTSAGNVAPTKPTPELKAGLDRQTARRLRQGKMAVQAKLDLHGMVRQEAHLALQAFLQRAQTQGKRCVLVITGKGRMSKDGGVLRRELPQWLVLPPCRDIVLSSSPARQEDGGEGAFYILLRRIRGAS